MGLFTRKQKQIQPAFSIDLTQEQHAELKVFIKQHRESCGIVSYDLTARNHFTRGARFFAGCPECGQGIELEGPNTPSTKLT